MPSFFARVAALPFLVGVSALGAPPSYNVTDITNWTPAQKATLPFFKHYIPLPVPNAPTDFHVASRTSSGFFAGTTFNVFTGPDQRGVLISGSSVSTIDSYGDFHWWRTTPPATATYRITIANDVNWHGVVVGQANLPGTSQVSMQGPDLPAITYTPAGGKVLLFPGTLNATPACINNRGEIAGWSSGGSDTLARAFRRDSSGFVTYLDWVPPGYAPRPKWINAEGVIIGTSVPGGWASAGGSSVFPLPRLFSMPLATPNDVNDAGWIVGTSEQWDHTEHYATLWEPNLDGTWTPHDLTELINTPDILLDSATAIGNNGHIIAVGHLDGGETAPWGVYLLTATNTSTNACVPEIGVQPADAVLCQGDATLSVVVIDPAPGTTYHWWKDDAPISTTANPSAATPTLHLTNVHAQDTGVYSCVVTGPCGSEYSATSDAASVDVTTCCPADLDDDGVFNNGLAPDGGVDINDLLAFLTGFELGDVAVDLDDGSGTGTPDGAVDINDLLSFLAHFEIGC